jgi:hypothetical protein
MTTTPLLASGFETGIHGIFDATAELPNVSGATIQNARLRVGMLALVNVAGTVSIHACTLATAGSATWAQMAIAGVTMTGAITATGDITTTTGNVVVTAGNVTAAAGTVSASDLDATDDLTVGDDAAITGLATVGETLGVTGAITASSTLAVTGAATLTGGIAGDGELRLWNHDTGAVIASRGDDAVSVAGTIYYGELIAPRNFTVTNVYALMGSTNGSTDKIIAAIYVPDDGVLQRSSDLAGVAMSTADLYLKLPLTATFALVAGKTYLVAIQVEGTTDTVQRLDADAKAGVTGSQTGSFGTMATISSVATAFTADLGPIVFCD